MSTPLAAHQGEHCAARGRTRPHQVREGISLTRHLKHLHYLGVQISGRIAKDSEIRGFIISFCLLLILIVMLIPTTSAEKKEAKFIRANMAAMNRAIVDMTVKMTGSLDADFVNMMEPHHLGTLEMARLEIRFGRNERLRVIAQKIATEQQQEITAMRQALKYTPPMAMPVSKVQSPAACRIPAQS